MNLYVVVIAKIVQKIANFLVYVRYVKTENLAIKTAKIIKTKIGVKHESFKERQHS